MPWTTRAERRRRPFRPSPIESPLMTLRMYLVVTAMLETGCGISAAIEAVAATALEHPEWDLDEQRTPAEWERQAAWSA